MALKKKLTKAEFEKLSEGLKAEYKEDGEGYKLDLDGDEDTGELKRAKDREVQARKDAEAKAAKLQEQIDSLSDSDARKRGDIETLEKSWKGKLDQANADASAKVLKLQKHANDLLVENVASSLAAKLSDSPKIIKPHILQRLKADLEGDNAFTRVLDLEGKPSALTIDDLENEFRANKDFSAIIKASKASGGAGSGTDKPKVSGGAGNEQQKLADLSKMAPKDLAAHLTAQKETAQQ